ncbi:hypothetical protein BT69DRAFT_959333 [Atractiella rhizophila]|nr:hypothetical protein BT69DRAFT_959333 [Atractiella rhizophila]
MGKELQSLPSELLLRVLSYVEADDLVRVGRLNTFWNAMAEDRLLWKRLYHQHFPLTVLRRSLLPNVSKSTSRSWKTLYKISIRWRALKAKTSSVSLSSYPTGPNTLLQHSGGVIFTAAKKHVVGQDGTSRIGVWNGKGLECYGYIPLEQRKEGEDMTALQVDTAGSKSDGSLLLGAFYSTGSFTLYSVQLDPSAPSLRSTVVFHRSQLHAPITQVAFHSPLLVTLVSSGRLNFWTVDKGGDGCLKVTPNAESALTAPYLDMPCVLSLTRRQEQSFDLSLAYTMPSYPPSPESAYATTMSSVVAVQSFTIRLDKEGSAIKIDRDASDFSVSIPAPIVYSTSSTDGSPSLRRMRGKKRKRESSDSEDGDRRMPPPAPTSTSRLAPPLSTGVTSITFSPPHILTSHSSNVVRSYLVPSSPGLSTGILPHTSVSYLPSPLLSLSSSTEMEKCVSGGKDGQIRVWDLGSDGAGMVLQEEGEEVRGKIVEVGFDEDRIVCITVDEEDREILKVYSFE